MNLLAHIYLSGGNSDLMIGNFIGDAVKGKQHENFSREIRRGILLHRKIDHYTDTHPITQACKKYFSKEFGLHAGIVVDIMYDHFLAKNWTNYHEQSFAHFSQSTYRYLERKIWVMPKKMQFMTPYFIESDWLNLYSSLQGIHRVLHGMSLRTSVPSKANYAKTIIEHNFTVLEQNFIIFFADLQENTRIM